MLESIKNNCTWVIALFTFFPFFGIAQWSLLFDANEVVQFAGDGQGSPRFRGGGMVNDKQGVIVGEMFLSASSGILGAVWVTEDGGETWDIEKQFTTGYGTGTFVPDVSRSGIYIVNRFYGYSPETHFYNGTLRHINHELFTVSASHANTNKRYYLHAISPYTRVLSIEDSAGLVNDVARFDSISADEICFISEDIGFLVARDGLEDFIIYKTENGGQRFTSVFSDSLNDYKEFVLLDDTTCYAIKNDSILVRSTDGLITWNAIALPVDEQYNSIDFLDIDNGFIAGNNGHLFETHNGGVNFTYIDINDNGNVSKVVYLSNGLAYARVDDNKFYGTGFNYQLKKDDKDDEYLVSPNPADNTIVIMKNREFPNHEIFSSLKIIDLTGRIVMTPKQSSSGEINVNSLKNGEYILQFFDVENLNKQHVKFQIMRRD